MECIATCHLSQSQSLLVHVYKPEFHLGAPQLELTCNTSSSLLAVLLRRLHALRDITLITTVINSNNHPLPRTQDGNTPSNTITNTFSTMPQAHRTARTTTSKTR